MSSSSSASSASAAADSSKSEESKKQESAAEEASGETPKTTTQDRIASFRARLLEALPRSITENDQQTWGDAWRELLGQRPSRPSGRAAAEPESGAGAGASSATSQDDAASAATAAAAGEWYEAVDDATGKTYYYNDAGDTRWDPPPGGASRGAPEGSEAPAPDGAEHTADDGAAAQASSPKLSPEEEAEQWAEARRQAGPSLYETKIAEIGKQISELEEQRELAMEEQRMVDFKRINGEIRDLRREIETLTTKMNTTAVVVVEEQKGAWEKFSENLRNTPLLGRVFGLGDSDAAKKAREAAEEAREVWETSQNPWVYRMHSAYDSLFSENEFGETVREVRRLDPTFTLEDFQVQLEEDVIPRFIGAFLQGDLGTLEEMGGEAAAAATKAAVEQRMQAKRKMDTHILGISQVTVLNAKVVDKLGPMIAVQFMVQQINCLYDLEGNVVEGKDDDVVGAYYVFAMVWDTEVAQWKVGEFMLVGKVPYI